MRLLWAFLIALLLAGCTVGQGTGVFPPEANLFASPPMSSEDDGRDLRIVVANGLGETLSLVERKSGIWTVQQDVVAVGQAPNQVVARNGRIYVVNSLSNSIQVIDSSTWTTVAEISTGQGTNPVRMAFTDNGLAVVTCYLSNEVLLVDVSSATTAVTDRVLARIPMPSPDELPHDPGITTNARPGGVAVVGDTCFVACANLSMTHVAGGPGVVVRVDLKSRDVTGVHVLEGRDTTGLLYSDRFPERLVAVSAGNYVAGSGFDSSGMVESLELATGKVFQAVRVEGAPFDGAIGAGDILFCENAAEGVVLRADLRAGEALESFELPRYGSGFSYASSVLALPGLLCVTDFNSDRLYLIDPVSGDLLGELATGDGPDAMALIEQR